MASKVSILNMALVNVGSSGFIQDPGENSAEANHCRVVYDEAVKSTLEALDWNFARVKVALADLGTPDGDWVYQYAYPSNCIKARKIQTAIRNEKPFPFKIGLNSAVTQKVVNTDIEDAVLIFTANVTNTELFSSAFAIALSWQIAMGISGPLSGNDKNIMDKVRTGLATALAQAQVLDANEGQEDDERDAPWIKEYE